MRKTILTLCLLAVCTLVMAVPVRPGLWSTIQLKDGTKVRVEAKGDEYGHWLRSAEGKCYIMTEEGYVETTMETVQAKRLAKMNVKKSARRKAIYASTSDGLGQYNKMSMGAVPSIGNYTIPVVMVQFSDTKFKSTTTVEKMTRYYNEEGYQDEDGCVGSVRDYFKSQSGGMFVPTFDVVGIVTLEKKSTYYGKGDDENLYELPVDVVKAAVETLGTDFSKYVVPAADENHQTGVPLLVMFYAGKGEATEAETTANRNLLWPCEWDYDEAIDNGIYNDVQFNSFFIGNELYTGGYDLMGLGVFCHEMGHALGLPDFYCTLTYGGYSGDDAFGNWSIMDTGAYVGDSYAPVGYNAYEKSYLGWLNLPEVGDATEVTLDKPVDGSVNSAYIIRNSSTETFIFENRQPSTWYPTEQGSGVMVSRIAYSYNQWYNDGPNNTQSKKRACILTADGAKLDYSGTPSNLYGNGKNKITSLKTLSGGTKTINITGITKNSDGTIKLTFGENGGGGGDDPGITPTGDYLFYESFDKCAGTSGWSGSVASAAFTPDNNGWEADIAYGGNKCARFGNSGNYGLATTPAFTVNGTATLTFKAGAWNSTKDNTGLMLSVSNGSISPSVVTMTKGAWDTFTATITANGATKVTFAAEKGRFFLDEVLVEGTATGIHEISVRNTEKSGRIYTLDGRYVGNDLSVLRPGLYIVDGKKVMR